MLSCPYNEVYLHYKNTIAMDENIFEFLLESQSIMIELDRLIDRYGLRGKLLSCNVQGVLLPDPEDESGSRLYSVYNLVAESNDEVDTLKDFIQDIWDSEDDDLDNLLRDAGIRLN